MELSMLTVGGINLFELPSVQQRVTENEASNAWVRSLVEIFVQRELSLDQMKELYAKVSRIAALIDTVNQESPSDNRSPNKVDFICEGIYLGGANYWEDVVTQKVLEGYPEGFQPDVILSLCMPALSNGSLVPKEFLEEIKKHWFFMVPIAEKLFDQSKIQFPSVIGTLFAALVYEKKILIHCRQGASRSPALLALFLTLLTRKEFAKVLDFLRSVRPIVHPLMEQYPGDCGRDWEGKPNFVWQMQKYLEGELLPMIQRRDRLCFQSRLEEIFIKLDPRNRGNVSNVVYWVSSYGYSGK